MIVSRIDGHYNYRGAIRDNHVWNAMDADSRQFFVRQEPLLAYNELYFQRRPRKRITFEFHRWLLRRSYGDGIMIEGDYSRVPAFYATDIFDDEFWWRSVDPSRFIELFRNCHAIRVSRRKRSFLPQRRKAAVAALGGRIR